MMSSSRVAQGVLTVACVTAAACGHSRPQAPLDASELLTQIEQGPASAGEHIYRGRVQPIGKAAKADAFAYDRRVRDAGNVLVSTHLTWHADAVILAERATHNRDYKLSRFEASSAQDGSFGSAQVVGDRIEFSYTVGGKERRRVQKLDAPVVVGPTLFGFALAHWDELAGGAPTRVRFAVLERLSAVAFELRLRQHDAETTTFELRASSAFVRLAIKPMHLVFDTKTRRVLSYEGRVPPKRATKRGLKAFDAHVEYSFVAPDFI